MGYTHASIVPLIGGMTIAQMQVFGTPPEYLQTYSAFGANEEHLRKWLDQHGYDVPYEVIDNGPVSGAYVDVMGTTCPCAGLSSYSLKSGADNPTNDWMVKTAEHVLEDIRPRVFWGENSPNFMGKIGAPVLENLHSIGAKNGYTMLVYGTKSILHGSPQYRRRCFYLFFRGDQVPVFPNFDIGYKPLREVILGAAGNFQNDVINLGKPSDDPYYLYLLNVIRGGISHAEYAAIEDENGSHGQDVLSIIEDAGHSLEQVGRWMVENNHTREAIKCFRKHEKILAGGNIMRRHTIVAKNRIGAFVGHHPLVLAHPVEDRFVTVREALAIMGMPLDMELIGGRKNANHICQNVPVMTARDMASGIEDYLEGRLETRRASLAFQHNGGGFDVKKGDPSGALESFFD